MNPCWIERSRVTVISSVRTGGSIAPARTLHIAYTPDSDDVFNFFGWEHGHVSLPGYAARFGRSHIAVLNRAAMVEAYEVVAISSVVYPLLSNRYWILGVGSSVGRGYGPVLVSKRYTSVEALAGRRVAVAGLVTTGGTLARMACPTDAEFVEMPYDRIADAILDDEVDAGVMIHEELVHYPELGLRRVRDLGAAWSEETGLPLPVGLNVARRSLGRETAEGVARTCRDSFLWAREHRAEALEFANRFGRGCAADFVPMFSNDDTLRMPTDVRRGLRTLFDQLAERQWAPPLETIEVIDA